MLKQFVTNRLLPQDRILLLDVVRGTAILGILLMNMQSYAMVSAVYSNPFAAGIPGRQEYSLWLAVHILVDQKFLTLLAILFGAGIVLLSDRLEARGQAADPIMRRRMIWLMIFGLMHAYLIWYGDILFAYGLCGLVAMQFRAWPPRRLFLAAATVLGLSIAVSVTFGLTYHLWPESVRQSGLAAWQPSARDLTAEVAAYRGGYLSELSYRWRQASLLGRSYMPVILGVRALVGMLLGMGLLKLHFFDLRGSGSRYVRLMLAGLGLGMPLVALGVITNTRHGWAYPYALFFGSQFNNVGSLCVALGYLGLLSLLVRQYGQSLASRVLQAVGRTALSNYILQSIFCTLVFYGIGLGLFEQLSRLQQLAGVILIWIFEAILSVLWLRYRQYGPLEWLWRRLTYGSAWARREKDYRQPTGVSY